MLDAVRLGLIAKEGKNMSNDYKKLFDIATKELAMMPECPPDRDDCEDEHKFNLKKCSECWKDYCIRREVKC